MIRMKTAKRQMILQPGVVSSSRCFCGGGQTWPSTDQRCPRTVWIEVVDIVNQEVRLCFCQSQKLQDAPFVKVESLDNRMIFVRRDAVSDIFFSSEAYDDYGPEVDRYDEVLGIFPDDDFWRVAEAFDYLSDVEDEFDPEFLADAKAKLMLTDAELDELIANGSVKPEDRQKVRAEVEERTEKFIALARNVTWQMGSCRREALAPDGRQLFERFGWLEEDPDAHERPLFLITEGYHRTIVINPNALDYICIPAHKLREGEIEEAEAELKDA